MADVSSSLKDWSTTASSNSPADATTVGSGLADNLQEIQKVVRQDLAHKGADIASAGTTDIGAIAGSTHDITGTTTITSFGTVSAGITKVLKFEGALTLTHNATSLILPGAANIPIQIGDCITVTSEGSGNWRVTNYEPAVRIGGLVLLETQALTGTVVDFTKFSSFYDDYVFVVDDLDPVTDGATLNLRLSEDGGSSFVSSGYAYIRNVLTAAVPTSLGGAGSDSSSEIGMLGSLSNSTLASGTIELYAANSVNSYLTWRFGYVNNSATLNNAWGSGRKTGSAASNAARFFLNSGGSFNAGTIRLYGRRK